MAFRKTIDKPASWRVELYCDTCHNHIVTIDNDDELGVQAIRLRNIAPHVMRNHTCYTGMAPRS
jgi:hypothetical protein